MFQTWLDISNYHTQTINVFEDIRTYDQKIIVYNIYLGQNGRQVIYIMPLKFRTGPDSYWV